MSKKTGAASLVATANPPPKRQLRERIIGRSIKIVSSTRRMNAFEVGESLVAAARRFPREVGPLAAELLNHEQSWTYLIGWAAAVAAGPDYYRLDDLPDSMRICINSLEPNMRSSLGGGTILGGRREQGLLQNFILEAASALREQGSPDLAEAVILDALNNPNLGTLGFVQKAQKLLISQDKIEAARKIYDKYTWSAWPLRFDQNDYSKALFIFCESIFDALDLSGEVLENGNKPGTLLHLSAFLAASKFGKIPGSDVWVWTRPFDKEATRETLKGFIGLSGLDVEKLRSDSVRARSYLSASSKNTIFEITTDIDPPVIDWTIASTLELDIKKIEAALYHPSQWIVWIAANLIENLVPQPELEQTVRRLFNSGKGYTLWAASGLAAELNQDQAVELLIERLSKPLVRGCEYLFKLLRQFELPWDANLADILSRGLRGDVEIGEEAARLAVAIARPGQIDLATIIEDASIYWIENEEPYPTQGGAIPHSPRAKLTEALLKIRTPRYNELKTYISDQRSDVKDIASDKLIDLLRLSDGPRMQFLNDICSEILPSNLLGKALEIMAPLKSEELVLWEGLLVSGNPKIRFNAMSLLHKDYLDPVQVRTHAQSMTRDTEQQIRDRAYRILDTL